MEASRGPERNNTQAFIYVSCCFEVLMSRSFDTNNVGRNMSRIRTFPLVAQTKHLFTAV